MPFHDVIDHVNDSRTVFYQPQKNCAVSRKRGTPINAGLYLEPDSAAATPPRALHFVAIDARFEQASQAAPHIKFAPPLFVLCSSGVHLRLMGDGDVEKEEEAAIPLRWAHRLLQQQSVVTPPLPHTSRLNLPTPTPTPLGAYDAVKLFAHCPPPN